MSRQRPSAGDAGKRVRFNISGMDCAEEVAVIKRELMDIVGDERNLSFDVMKGTMTVEPGGNSAFIELIVRAVGRTGMTAKPIIGTREDATSRGAENTEKVFATIVSGLFAFTGLAIHAWRAGGLLAALGSEGLGTAQSTPRLASVAYSVGILAGTWFVLPKAWYALRRFRPDMNLLMVVAIIGAIALGDWFEAATVAFLFALSLMLESWSVGRARRAVEALLTLSPPTARLLDDSGRDTEVLASEVPVGARIVVRPGERIPLDGTVQKGTSGVDQSPITGESMPVTKEPGAAVFAGTINGDGVLEIEISKAAEDSTLAHIVRMVEQAQGQRAKAEQWVEKFARIYTPAVMAVAVLMFAIPVVGFQQDWHTWLYRSLVLLVISCPCALVISTPVSVVAGLAAAARQGVLVKGGEHLEKPATLKALAFDKTGTITEGKPNVVEIVPWSDHTEKELLEIAARLEAQSQHPLALAIVKKAKSSQIDPAPAESVQNISGKGLHGKVDGEDYWLGSHRYLEERKQETPEIHERLESMAGAGRSIVVIGNESHVCGFIAIADRIRPGMPETLQELRNLGVAPLVMLTGDNKMTAEAIAREAGVDSVMSELLPAEKVDAVAKLTAEYGTVGMIGDGVNDAPALSQATIGIAMGAVGSDAAIEAADVALMSDDLSKVAWLIGHSRRTLRVIRQNIAISLMVKAVFAALAMTGYASLWAAIGADMGASLVVIANGLRLLK